MVGTYSEAPTIGYGKPHEAGVAGAQPMRGEPEGCPLGTPFISGVGAKQRNSDAQRVDAGSDGVHAGERRRLCLT
jgi:hypothetical protein